MQLSDFESCYYEIGLNRYEQSCLELAKIEELNGNLEKKDYYYRAASRASKYRRIPIGYWYSKYQPKLPMPIANSTMLSNENLEIICKYLDNEKHGRLRQLGLSECRICKLDNGNADVYDDKYIWPSGLSHYLRKHKCELPDEFANYCLNQTNSET